MLLSLFNFAWILITAFLFGFSASHIMIHFNLLPNRKPAPDTIIISGIAVLTAYAQWFSLFHRVGILATLSLCAIDIMILVLLFRQIKSWIKEFTSSCCIYKYLLWLTVCAFFFSIIASTPPTVYDTALYHNQAIQWIEKYGIVKGLGNLHNRLAYNSSFFALQALFSWSSLVGQSLHGMNCFLAIFFSSYASFRLLNLRKTMRSSNHYYIEQCFNILILLQIYTTIKSVSSPNTDFLAMLLILYIFSRWARDNTQLSFLFLTAVFGATVKLSVASLVLLGIPLCIAVIQTKRWQRFLIYTVACSFLALPFFIRNVLISGYILYPSTFLDIFPFDWKMSAFAVTFDNHEIIAWGRGLRDVNKYNYPLSAWFPIWFQEMSLWGKVLFGSHIIFLPFSLYQTAHALSKRINYGIAGMLTISIAGLLSWFFSAPLLRYGNVYLYLLPAILIGYTFEKWQYKETVLSKIPALTAGLLLLLTPAAILPAFEVIRLINPSDYESYVCDTFELSPGVKIYYPKITPECTGYDAFPSTPYPKRFEVIELRGTTLKDGFRMKPELRKLNITTYGTVNH